VLVDARRTLSHVNPGRLKRAARAASLRGVLGSTARRDTMGNVKLSEVKKALPLARQLVAKIDADKDKQVSADEVKRIKVRDNFTARNMVRSAMEDRKSVV
jgi:hypothetical protein